ncbi:MAG: hypothetical protein EPN93_17080 [Spirochaetes bacterium]|nr:MAG: hypothetical protein EPN93_17080 [Spirochaetota bacterium]
MDILTTSINMHKDTRSSVRRAARTLKMSQRDIVVLLLKRIMQDIMTMQGEFTTVRYQPDDKAGDWHCFCIQYYPEEYEFFNDLRRLCKYTISYLVAIAVIKYMAELLGDRESVIINYLNYTQYAVGTPSMKGILCWHFYWGNPRLPEKINTDARILRKTHHPNHLHRYLERLC